MSPYLDRPLRTLEQAKADREARRLRELSVRAKARIKAKLAERSEAKVDAVSETKVREFFEELQK